MTRLSMLVAGLLLPASAATAEAPADFQSTAAIQIQGDGPYYRLSLPIEVPLAAHAPDLRDLRVFNGQGEAVPFSLIRDQARTEQAQTEIAVKWFPLYAAADAGLGEVRVERGADGTIVSVRDGGSEAAGKLKRHGYLLDTSRAEGSFRKLVLDWDPAVTGFQQLGVEASDDLQSWRQWEGEAQLARLDFNGEQVLRKQIDLPGGHAAYLRLTWKLPAEAPALTSALLTLGSATDRPAGFVWSDPAGPARSDKDGYEWAFARPIAFERLRIALPEVNVLTPVEISSRDDAPRDAGWRVLARPVLYRLLIDGKEWQQQEVTLRTAPLRLLRLVPDPRGGGLGGTPTLSIGIGRQDLVFLARGAAPFTLAIGRDDTPPADLPPATLMPGWGTSNAPPISPARTGPFSARPAPAGGAGLELPAGGWQSLVLWGVLLLGVGAIGLMAVKLLRQSRA